MRDLASLAGRTGGVRRLHRQIHPEDCGHVELETLAGAQPGSNDDFDLGQLVGPAADTVESFTAQEDPAPDFPDPELRSSHSASNLSTGGLAASTPAPVRRLMRPLARIVVVLAVATSLSATVASSLSAAPLTRSANRGSYPSRKAAPVRYTKLVWSDEFNGPPGTSPSASKWIHDVGAWGYTNHELEAYTNSPANGSYDGHGDLAIVARRQTTGAAGWTRHYTSARLETQGLFSATHGLIEARMKLPAGAGLWPAFWMLGNDVTSVGWPGCGEVDILEALGQHPSVAHGFINGPSGGATHYTVGHTNVSRRSLASGFHTYAIKWSKNSITWLLDGVPYGTVTPKDLPSGARWVYNRPFHLVLNLAVGGSWGGPPTSSTHFPATLLVNWVRVYQ